MFAIWEVGFVAVPVKARLHRNEMAYILAHSGTSAAFTGDGSSNCAEPPAPRVRRGVVGYGRDEMRAQVGSTAAR
jgi:long-chain acyl-CoA synthetase